MHFAVFVSCWHFQRCSLKEKRLENWELEIHRAAAWCGTYMKCRSSQRLRRLRWSEGRGATHNPAAALISYIWPDIARFLDLMHGSRKKLRWSTFAPQANPK